jgi:hypothetical protein
MSITFRKELIMINEKGLGGKRINRLNLSITNEDEKNINMLATACGMKPASIAYEIFLRGLNDIQLLNELQKEYCIQSAYRIVFIQHDGRLEYTLAGREDI